MSSTTRTALLLFLAIAAFYWKITLSRQYRWDASEESKRVAADLAETIREWNGGQEPRVLMRDGEVREGYRNWYFAGAHWLAALAAYGLFRTAGIGEFAAAAGGFVFAVSGVAGLARGPAGQAALVLMPPCAAFLLRSLRDRRWRDVFALAALTGAQAATSAPGIPLLTGAAVAASWAVAIWRDRTQAPAAGLWLLAASVAFALFPPSGPVGSYQAHQRLSLNPVELFSVPLAAPAAREDLFVGTIVTLAALAGLWRERHSLRGRAIAVCGFASLLFAFGMHAGVHGALYALISRFVPMPAPVAALPLFHLSVAAAFALGIDGDGAALTSSRWWRTAAISAGVFAVLAAQILSWIGRDAGLDRMVLSGWCTIAAGLTAGNWHRYRRGRERWIPWLIITLVAIELTGHANALLRAGR